MILSLLHGSCASGEKYRCLDLWWSDVRQNFNQYQVEYIQLYIIAKIKMIPTTIKLYTLVKFIFGLVEGNSGITRITFKSFQS
jgi:hypothetical protein